MQLRTARKLQVARLGTADSADSWRMRAGWRPAFGPGRHLDSAITVKWPLRVAGQWEDSHRRPNIRKIFSYKEKKSYGERPELVIRW